MDTISHALTEAVVGSYAMSGLLVVSVGTGIAVWVWKKYSDKNSMFKFFFFFLNILLFVMHAINLI